MYKQMQHYLNVFKYFNKMEMKEQNNIERNIVYSELLILLQNADDTIRSDNKKLEVKDVVEPNSHYNITEDAARTLFSVDDISSSISYEDILGLFVDSKSISNNSNLKDENIVRSLSTTPKCKKDNFSCNINASICEELPKLRKKEIVYIITILFVIINSFRVKIIIAFLK